MIQHSIFIAVAMLIAHSISFGQQNSILSTDGKAIVDGTGDTVLLRGMGLGGWMLQEGYMLQTSEFANAQYQIRDHIEELIGLDATQDFYDAWLANYLTETDVDSLKSWGFNSIRLPMHYNLFTLPIEDEPVPGEHTWLEKGFQMVDTLVEWCRERDIYIILDLHAAPGGQGYNSSISDYDPTKPSLWESTENQDKTVALWRRLAERYADEPVIAGYDLLNEPNWDLPGGVLLRDVYERITEAIREVDTDHILFIEGNWFANDFTGLTPPWDDNLVYSPHKYWSYNEKADIQWVLTIRDQYNVPLYLGESGENSNTWFRDAIKLLEGENIGWAWWTWKKVATISAPLSVNQSPEYTELLEYWKGNAPEPSVEDATATLMQLAEDLKIENCSRRPDMIDAMFRQVQEETAIPYNGVKSLPGIIHSSDFDMGAAGIAYDDTDLATYHVNTGQFTAWNTGWSYRNDGVDIQPSEDNINSNGYNVGWTKRGEWMRYTIASQDSSVYDVNVRVATNNGNGKFHFESRGAQLTDIITVPNTGDYQSWQTVTIPDVVLTPEDESLYFVCDGRDFNVGSFEFVETSPMSEIETKFVYGKTISENQIQINCNKPLINFQGTSNFQIFLNNEEVEVQYVSTGTGTNTRTITLVSEREMKSSDVITVSYNDDKLEAIDGTALVGFTKQPIDNLLAIVSTVPGRVQAEDFFTQQGIELENTTDDGGGFNIGFLDVGDYADYTINVAQDGIYRVSYRAASLDQSGGLSLSLENNGEFDVIQYANFTPTGGWQDWETFVRGEVALPAGLQTLRMEVTKANFNLNWILIESTSSSEGPAISKEIVRAFPNPVQEQLNVIFQHAPVGTPVISVHNTDGRAMDAIRSTDWNDNRLTIDLAGLPEGVYYLSVTFDGKLYTVPFVK